MSVKPQLKPNFDRQKTSKQPTMDSNTITNPAQADPTTPILIFTSDASDSSATSSPSDSSKNSYGWTRHSATAEQDKDVDSHSRAISKDTAYATLHHGYGSSTNPTLKSQVQFHDLLSMSQISGAPVQASHPKNSKFTFNDTAGQRNPPYQPSRDISDGRRRHSSSQYTGVPYRQSSLKWKQRNGSATFELKLSQEEFASRHT